MTGLKHIWIGGAVVVAVGGFLYAQPAPKDKEEKPTVSGLSVGKLSITDMQMRQTELRKQVKDDNRHTLHLRESARKQKDVIKLNCVNDKYVQMKAQTNIFDSAGSELETSLSAGTDSRFSAFAEVAIGAESVHKLRQEADVCVGEGGLPTSEFPPEVVGPGIPQPGGNPFDEPVEPPGYASPFN